jgi:hypothetical protein
MLSQLDNLIFPDRCDVLEVSPQRFVYPIFKNGFSSLSSSGFRIIDHEELSNLDTVEIFVRDPIERFFSGLNSYVGQNEHLDRDTVITLAVNHLFINRHFAPQFHWLVNLRRFTRAKIKINPINKLSKITNLHLNENKNKIKHEILQFPKVLFYMQLDKILTEKFLGHTVSFPDIVAAVRTDYPDVYQEVIHRSISLCNALV